MTLISTGQGLALIAVFGAGMALLTLKAARNRTWSADLGGFLYARRDVGTIPAAFSIAASWIWAPALFVSVQKSYEFGLAGLFWFTAPNVLAVLIYTALGPAIRRRIPSGFSIPDWIRHRFAGEGPRMARLMHFLFLIPHAWYQIMAVTVQLFVGGMIVNYMTDISVNMAMALMLAVVLAYSYVAGLRASIITDMLHIALLLAGLALIVPWVAGIAGIHGIAGGMAGIRGSSGMFDPHVAFSFGIVTSIGLLAGAVADQQFWQRCFAIREDRLIPAFALGGVIFSTVPIALSVLGFVAANPAFGIAPPASTDLPMIGIAAAAKLLPHWVMLVFAVMLLCGLTSSLDSGLIAGASLYAIDMRGGHENDTAKQARRGMIGFAVAGLIVAFAVWRLFPLDRLWWLFNGVGAMFVTPTILSIFWKRLSARGVIIGLAGSVPPFAVYVYANYLQNDVLAVYSALAILGINFLGCALFSRRRIKA